MDIQKKYQKDTGKLLPTAGNTLDIGPGITHKRDVVDLYAKGYNPIEIARKTDHNLNNVETYIGDMERVKEYLEIIRTYYPECIHLNSKEVNIEGKGN